MNTHSLPLPAPMAPPYPLQGIPTSLSRAWARLDVHTLARQLWRRWSGRHQGGTVDAEARALLAQATPLRVPYGGLDLAAWRWHGTRRRVLLVHGWTSRAATMAPLVRSLVDAGHEVIAFDAPGAGLSPGTRGNLIGYADTIRRVDELLGGFDVIVAHGTGATAALMGLGPTRARAWALLAPSDPPRVVASWCRYLGGSRGAQLWSAVEDLVLQQAGVPTSTFSLLDAAHEAGGSMLVAHGHLDVHAPFEHGASLATAWPGARFVDLVEGDHRSVLHDDAVHQAIVRLADEAW